MAAANTVVSVPLETFGYLTRRRNSNPKRTKRAKANHGSDGELIPLDVRRKHMKKSGRRNKEFM
jgi:hypothetical protein